MSKSSKTHQEWAELRTEYITSSLSYAELAKKHGVSYSALTKRAAAEEWANGRVLFGKELANNLKENALADATARCQKALEMLGQSAEALTTKILSALEDTEQLYRYIVKEGTGKGESKTVCKSFKKLDTRAIRDLASAMKDLANTVRNVFNVPNAHEQLVMDIASERLKLQQAKAEQDESDGGCQLVFGSMTAEEARRLGQ